MNAATGTFSLGRCLQVEPLNGLYNLLPLKVFVHICSVDMDTVAAVIVILT